VEETYGPRAVAIVALVALVFGFLIVFGGGMALLRPHSRDVPGNDPSVPAPRPVRAPPRTSAANSPPGAAAEPSPPSEADEPRAAPSSDDSPSDASAAGTIAGRESPADAATPPTAQPTREPVQAGGITLGPASTSRCFNAGSVEPILAAQCDQLPDLDRHIQAHAADIAHCVTNGAHGRLLLVLDFRISTRFMRGWGSPTSNIPNAGTVSACVKTALTPLPFSTMQHQHDRYLLTVVIDW